MDELKFREGLNRIIPTLKLFVAGFADEGKSFVNHLNGLDKSLVQNFFVEYSTKKNEKINRVRITILEKLLEGDITVNDINSIFDDEKKKWNKDQLKVWTIPRIIYPFCYGENKSEEKFTEKFLLELCDEIIEKAGYDRDIISKPGQINFDGATNFGKNGFYVSFGNNTHPDYTTMDQFRIESEGDSKLNVGIYHHGDGFVGGKYKSFDINLVTLQDIIDEAVVVKNDVESDIYSGDNIPNIMEYLKENVSKYVSKKDEAEEQRKVFLDKYPLEKLKNLNIEDYIYVKGKGNNEESFTKLLRCNSKSAVAIGELVENAQNFLFYKDEDTGKYIAARVMDDYKKRAGGNVNDMFKLFISDTYDFINNFDENNYNQSDYIQGATYLKSAIFFFYKGDIILNIGSQNIAQAIANQFGINDKTDAIGYDILLSKYLNDKEPDLVNEYGFYAIGRCLYEYFKRYLKNIKHKNTQVEVVDDYLSLKQLTMVPLNTILYGVPGTGKTFNTINYAVSIIEGVSVENIIEESKNNRSAVKKRYEDYLKKGLIVFTTFHQSYGYEDFIEGIKASVDGNTIKYSVEPGCFKSLCDRARSGEGFESVYNKFLSDISEIDEPLKLRTITGKTFGVMLNSKNNVIIYTGKDLKPNGVITKDNLQRYLGGDKSMIIGWEGYYNGIIDYFKSEYKLDTIVSNNNKYVFIIDEINRGNISKIFGELITLIEPDKRLGGKEELKVTLPYSNQRDFGIPNNIYIIGTMNTADRSIALIDLALRRRFKFIEIEPKSDLLNGITVAGSINIKSMFEKINERIEFLYDRDHLLGHAYFLPLKDENTLEKLNSIMLNDVIPQLQEYFHDDWEKIQLVLGDGLIKNEDMDPAKIIGYSGDYDIKQKYSINNDPKAEDYLKIYQPINNDKSE